MQLMCCVHSRELEWCERAEVETANLLQDFGREEDVLKREADRV